MIYFKSCPRCRGDVVDDEDTYGKYHKCMQCSREVPPGSLMVSYASMEDLVPVVQEGQLSVAVQERTPPPRSGRHDGKRGPKLLTSGADKYGSKSL